jgi:hypothetical protein
MRCPTCGTENTPDSRFCGGCGAKQFPSEGPRLAPTEKISDDAPFPKSIPPNSTYAAPAGYSSGPASIPPPAAYPTPPPGGLPPYVPTTNPGAAIPPRGASLPPGVSRANSAPPEANSLQRPPVMAAPSMSMPTAPPRQTRWGLVILVLILDLGLAAAGAVMLGKGLAKPDRSDAPKADPAPVQLGSGSGSTVAPKPAGSAAAVTPSAGSALLEAAHEDTTAKAATSARSAVKTDKKTQKQTKLEPAGSATGSSAPPPPPPEIDVAKALGNEIELQATRTRETFDRCYFDAGGASAIHGIINVAFQVLTDGRIANVSAVENTTGSLSLANCLTGSIAHWTFATHPVANANFVRPFNYP